MDKRKTSQKRNGLKLGLSKWKPSDRLKDPSNIVEIMLDCLKENDLESFRDALVGHLTLVNKSKLAAESKVGRRTIYDLMDPEKPFNPTVQTLGPLLKAIGGRK